jgi:hypothetical protein
MQRQPLQPSWRRIEIFGDQHQPSSDIVSWTLSLSLDALLVVTEL